MILAALLSGCAGSLENPEEFAFLLDGSASVPDAAPDDDDAGGGGSDEPPECVTEAFTTGCGTATCHGEGALQIDLESPGLAERLVDQPSKSEADNGACPDRVFVATDGEPSLLLQKLSTSSDCGSPMPLGRSMEVAWDEEQYDCVEAWVISLGGSALEAAP